MVSDLMLLRRRFSEFGKLSRSEAARELASIYNLSVDSVRGRLSRTDTTQNRTHILKSLSEVQPTTNPSVARQKRVLERGAARYGELSDIGGERRLMFLSDIHVPYTRWDAYQLAMLLLDDFAPHYVTGQNDFRDNNGFGRWDDTRPARGRVWTGDVQRVEELERIHYSAIRERGATILGVAGNHDLWYYKHLRENTPQIAEREIADYMEALEDMGVIQFSRGVYPVLENIVVLSPSLAMWHGKYTNKNINTLAKNNISYILDYIGDGRVRSVIGGHTHRPCTVDATHLGLSGATFYNSGALTDYTPYMDRKPNAHGFGVTLSRFYHNDTPHETDVVRFSEKGNKLVARYAGVTYDVPLTPMTIMEYD